MKIAINSSIVFLLTALILLGIGAGLYILSADFFFGFAWFFLIIAIFSKRLSLRPKSYPLYFSLLLFAVAWIIYNDALFYLISTQVNSNPYGEYFIDQFGRRLSLSIFVLKIVLKMWLTDTRLLIAGGLWLGHLCIFPRLLKSLFSALPTRYFELVVLTTSRAFAEVQHYAVRSFVRALISGALWCVAAFLLQFDNFILMTFIMLLCAFIPFIGLYVAALLSLLFVESGLFLIQLGGMLIALASIWFVDHTLFKNSAHITTRFPIVLLIVLLVLGYKIFAFTGFFLAGPLAYLSLLFSHNLSKNWTLIHKAAPPVPRNA